MAIMAYDIQTLRAPSIISCGGGARLQVAELIQAWGARRVLLVTDPGVISLGLHTDVVAALELAGCALRIFDGVQPDPTIANVAAGREAMFAHEAEVVVALGGGSAIDCAKVVAVAAEHGLELAAWMGREKVPGRGRPLIAIPTTAGTGSEVTTVAVITDSERDVKMMMLSGHLLPRAALVDYELSLGMPPGLTAAVGIDTLTHGIEAFVSRRAGVLTDPLARSCINLCARFLERAWTDGQDREARAGMMAAACQGGLAFCNSSVALVHGMSRPIGVHFHLPHGLSNAVLLPTITAWSLPGAPKRYAEVARLLGVARTDDTDAAAGAALVAALVDLNQRLGLPSLGEAIKDRRRFDAVREQMARAAEASGSPANNPRVPTVAEMAELYDQAWSGAVGSCAVPQE